MFSYVFFGLDHFGVRALEETGFHILIAFHVQSSSFAFIIFFFFGDFEYVLWTMLLSSGRSLVFFLFRIDDRVVVKRFVSSS